MDERFASPMSKAGRSTSAASNSCGSVKVANVRSNPVMVGCGWTTAGLPEGRGPRPASFGMTGLASGQPAIANLPTNSSTRIVSGDGTTSTRSSKHKGSLAPAQRRRSLIQPILIRILGVTLNYSLVRLIARLFSLIITAAILVAPFSLLAQTASTISSQVITPYGGPATSARVLVCPITATGLPCSPISTLYSDPALSHEIPNPTTADQYGNYSVFVNSGGIYIVQVTPQIGTTYSYMVSTSAANGSAGGGGVFPGTVNYVGVYANSANIGPATTTVNSIAPVLQGNINSDLFATGGGNNGIGNALVSSVCITIDCYIGRPVNSSDTTTSQPLAVTANTNSSLLVDDQRNTLAVNATNPQPSNNLANVGSSGGPLTQQSLYPDYLVYSQPNPGTVQGAEETWRNHFGNYVGAGYSLGNTGCPNNCAQSHYTGGASQWSVYVDDSRQANFNSAGIRQTANTDANCYGIGDCTIGMGYFYEQYAGGCITAGDECAYALFASHFDTPGDMTGILTTITDTTHMMLTPNNAWSTSQGDGRYVMDTSAPIYTQISASTITAPTTVPGTIVFPSANFPASDAVGTLATACIVPIQDKGIASTSCVVNVTSGALVVSGDPVCLVSNTQNNGLDFGGQITAVTSLSGGQQTMTVKIRKTLDPADKVVYVYQSSMCGTVIDLASDITATARGGGIVHGSVFPIVNALDAHTLQYFYANSSQVWQPIPAFGSFFRTTAIDGGGTPSGGSYNLINLTRTGNVVTAIGVLGNSYDLAEVNFQRYYSISGCSDTTFNIAGNPNIIVGAFNSATATFTYTQPGSNADSTCSAAVLTINNSLVNVDYAAEITDVADPTPGIPAAQVVDGYLATTYQPNFVSGHTMDVPPNYSSGRTGAVLSMETGQPYTNSSVGYVSQLANYDAFGQAAYKAINGVQTGAVGFGGIGKPADVMDIQGMFTNFLSSDTAPWPGGSVLSIGFPYSALPAGLQNFNMWDIANTGFQEHYDYPTNTVSDFFVNTGYTFTRSPSATTASLVPMVMQNAQFEGPVLGTSTFSPQSQMKSCAVNNSFLGVCYEGINDTPPVVTPVTTGSIQRAYWIVVNQANGSLSWTPAAIIYNSNATPDNNISCSVIPSGLTGTVYTIPVGFNSFQTVGSSANQCTSSSVTVTDSGTYGGALGGDARNLSGTFYAGQSIVDGNSSFGFTGANIFNGAFGTLNPLGVVQQISMPSANTFSFDTTTIGNAAATINAGAANVNGSPVCTIATGCGSTSGSAVFVAGTVTVSTSAAVVVAGTHGYQLTNCGAAGTAIGTPSLGTIVAGTSFVINSLTATNTVATGDTSKVCWSVK